MLLAAIAAILMGERDWRDSTSHSSLLSINKSISKLCGVCDTFVHGGGAFVCLYVGAFVSWCVWVVMGYIPYPIPP